MKWKKKHVLQLLNSCFNNHAVFWYITKPSKLQSVSQCVAFALCGSSFARNKCFTFTCYWKCWSNPRKSKFVCYWKICDIQSTWFFPFKRRRQRSLLKEKLNWEKKFSYIFFKLNCFEKRLHNGYGSICNHASRRIHENGAACPVRDFSCLPDAFVRGRRDILFLSGERKVQYKQFSYICVL